MTKLQDDNSPVSLNMISTKTISTNDMRNNNDGTIMTTTTTTTTTTITTTTTMIAKNNANPNWATDFTNVKFPLPKAAISVAYKQNIYDGINTKNDHESNTTSTNTTYENRIELSDNNRPVINIELNNNSLHPIDSTPSVKFKIDDRLSLVDVLPKTHLSVSGDENVSNITSIKRTGSMPSFSATKKSSNGTNPSVSNQSRHKRRHTVVSKLTETPIQYLERMRYTLSKLELITLLAKR